MRPRPRPFAERMLDVPQRLFEKLLTGETQVAATGLVRFLKQIVRSRAIDREISGRRGC